VKVGAAAAYVSPTAPAIEGVIPSVSTGLHDKGIAVHQGTARVALYSQGSNNRIDDSLLYGAPSRLARNHRNLEEPVLDAIAAVAQLPAFFGGLSEVMRLFKWRIRNSVRRTVGRVESSTALPPNKRTFVSAVGIWAKSGHSRVRLSQNKNAGTLPPSYV
jgi:hypothetical protein